MYNKTPNNNNIITTQPMVVETEESIRYSMSNQKLAKKAKIRTLKSNQTGILAILFFS